MAWDFANVKVRLRWIRRAKMPLVSSWQPRDEKKRFGAGSTRIERVALLVLFLLSFWFPQAQLQGRRNNIIAAPILRTHSRHRYGRFTVCFSFASFPTERSAHLGTSAPSADAAP